MKTFHMSILKADGVFVEGEAEIVIIPTMDGKYGVKANHANIVFSIVPGLLQYRMAGGEMKEAFVASGMMRFEDNDALILVESAEHPEDIDEVRAREKEAESREAMLQKKSRRDYYLAQASLIRATERLKVKNKKSFR